MMSVLVPSITPNVVPHARIRENPHVSKEEWAFLKSYTNDCDNCNNNCKTTQLKFLQLISKSARTLLSSMEIPDDDMPAHRIYDLEVIELSPDVAFILILPPVENVCSIVGQNDQLAQTLDSIYIPLQIFEMSMCQY